MEQEKNGVGTEKIEEGVSDEEKTEEKIESLVEDKSGKTAIQHNEEQLIRERKEKIMGGNLLSSGIGAIITIASALTDIDWAEGLIKIILTAIAAIIGGFLGALGKHYFHKWILKKKPKKKDEIT